MSILHPDWAKGFCVPFLMDECEELNHNNHISWKELQKKVYAEYAEKLAIKCNPEQNLESQEHYFQSKNICRKNFQGLCERRDGDCTKQHLFWKQLNKVAFIAKKVLRRCIEENKKENCQNLNKFQSQSLLCDENNLKKLQEAVKQQNIIDIIFIIDFTKSMQKWIDSCKSQIKGIIESFQKNIGGTTLRMGYVGYRDVNDVQKLAYHEITSDIEKLVVHLAKQKAEGGGDAAEDVCSGIEKPLSLNISKHKHSQSILITILFADAPCNGRQYHDGKISDDLADKVENGKLENLMNRYYFYMCQYQARYIKNIQYYAIKFPWSFYLLTKQTRIH